MARAEAERPPAAQPSAVVSADRATLLREEALKEAAAAIQAVIDDDRAKFPRRSNDRAALGAARQIVLGLIDKPSRVAAEEQPAETQEARLVELFVHYRVQLRDNDTVDWKPSHPSLDYEDREDAEESAAMGREYFPGREYRVVTRTTTITEQP